MIRMIISICLLLVSTNGFAFNFTDDFTNGFYWQRFPVNMKIISNDFNEANQLRTIVNNSVDSWEDSIGEEVWEVDSANYNDSSVGGNYIMWSDNIGELTGFDPSSTLAVTIRYSGGTFINRFIILLNSNVAYLKQNIGSALTHTIIHELGHTIGLGHSDDNNVIMSPSLNAQTYLQNDDVSGFNALVTETKFRQATGFVSPLSKENSEKNKLGPSCGTIDYVDGSPGSKGLSFLVMLLFPIAWLRFKAKYAS